MVHSKYYEDTYTNDDVSALCQIAGLRPEDLDKFREELEHTAAIYRWESSKYADIPRSSSVARDLEGLIKRINRLDLGLSELPDEAAHHLRVAIDRNNLSDFALTITESRSKDEPSLSVPLPEAASPVMALDFGVREVRQILTGLERAAQDAIKFLPKRGRGQTRDHGLRLWMSNLELVWERNTSAPFTRDETTSGEPITPAARFCVAAFHCISPDYPVTRIMWEMRDRIRRSKKSTCEIIARNKQ